jgi:membrane protein DedA with SNARE-associated domain
MVLLAFSFQTIDGWIEAGGYIALFGLLFACGLGLPLPEDIPLMIAGALIAKGKMHLAGVAIAAWTGIIGGDLMLYHFGKRFGLEITRVRFIGKHLTQERIKRVEEMFERYGVFVVAIGRMIAGVRGAMVVAAGAIRYNLVKFVIADGLAAIVSGGFFVFVGHWLGTRLNEKTIREFKHLFISCVLVIMLGFVVWIWYRIRRKPPGPGGGEPTRSERAFERVVKVASVTAHPTQQPPNQEPVDR